MNMAICGLGKAGQALAHKIITEKDHTLTLALCRDTSLTKGKDVGELLEMPALGIPIIPLPQCEKALRETHTDVIIDFSGKSTSLLLAEICKKTQVHLVICTTNFTMAEQRQVRELALAGQVGIVFAPNLTLGINLLMGFVKKISKILLDFDFEIIERHRKDKPKVTTTAQLISNAIDRGQTPISSIRAGGYVGIHEVTAVSEDERVTIVHESFSRNAFARGAIMAAEYVIGKAGYYEMDSVINDLEKQLAKE